MQPYNIHKFNKSSLNANTTTDSSKLPKKNNNKYSSFP